jgi:hypothetical protein
VLSVPCKIPSENAPPRVSSKKYSEVVVGTALDVGFFYNSELPEVIAQLELKSSTNKSLNLGRKNFLL